VKTASAAPLRPRRGARDPRHFDRTLPAAAATYNRGMKFLKRIIRICGIRHSRWAIFALAVGLIDLMADDVLAQKRANLPDEGDALMRYGVLIGVVGLIGVSAFLNPKRSHQA
jgi:hypothetical protein